MIFSPIILATSIYRFMMYIIMNKIANQNKPRNTPFITIFIYSSSNNHILYLYILTKQLNLIAIWNNFQINYSLKIILKYSKAPGSLHQELIYVTKFLLCCIRIIEFYNVIDRCYELKFFIYMFHFELFTNFFFLISAAISIMIGKITINKKA